MIEIKLKKKLTKALAQNNSYQNTIKLLNSDLASKRNELSVAHAELAEKDQEIKELKKTIKLLQSQLKTQGKSNNDHTN